MAEHLRGMEIKGKQSTFNDALQKIRSNTARLRRLMTIPTIELKALHLAPLLPADRTSSTSSTTSKNLSVVATPIAEAATSHTISIDEPTTSTSIAPTTTATATTTTTTTTTTSTSIAPSTTTAIATTSTEDTATTSAITVIAPQDSPSVFAGFSPVTNRGEVSARKAGAFDHASMEDDDNYNDDVEDTVIHSAGGQDDDDAELQHVSYSVSAGKDGRGLLLVIPGEHERHNTLSENIASSFTYDAEDFDGTAIDLTTNTSSTNNMNGTGDLDFRYLTGDELEIIEQLLRESLKNSDGKKLRTQKSPKIEITLGMIRLIVNTTNTSMDFPPSIMNVQIAMLNEMELTLTRKHIQLTKCLFYPVDFFEKTKSLYSSKSRGKSRMYSNLVNRNIYLGYEHLFFTFSGL
jgi:hypothetical protein